MKRSKYENLKLTEQKIDNKNNEEKDNSVQTIFGLKDRLPKTGSVKKELLHKLDGNNNYIYSRLPGDPSHINVMYGPDGRPTATIEPIDPAARSNKTPRRSVNRGTPSQKFINTEYNKEGDKIETKTPMNPCLSPANKPETKVDGKDVFSNHDEIKMVTKPSNLQHNASREQSERNDDNIFKIPPYEIPFGNKERVIKTSTRIYKKADYNLETSIACNAAAIKKLKEKGIVIKIKTSPNFEVPISNLQNKQNNIVQTDMDRVNKFTTSVATQLIDEQALYPEISNKKIEDLIQDFNNFSKIVNHERKLER